MVLQYLDVRNIIGYGRQKTSSYLPSKLQNFLGPLNLSMVGPTEFKECQFREIIVIEDLRKPGMTKQTSNTY